MEKRIEKLKDLIKVQCTDGTWNYDQYLFGMANGMICALSVFDDKEPKYLEAPDEWICDKRQKKELTQETIDAIKDVDNKVGLTEYESVDALFDKFRKKSENA